VKPATSIALLTWVPSILAAIAFTVLAFHIGQLKGEITGLRAWVADEQKMRAHHEQHARWLQSELADEAARRHAICPDEHAENER